MAQPQLKRRTSLRDKLRVWPRPVSILDTLPDTEEERSYQVYQPKHAAADFSRLTVTPPSSLHHECRPCVTASETTQVSGSRTRRAHRRPESANPLAEMRFRGRRRDMESTSLPQEQPTGSHQPRYLPQTVSKSAPLTDYELFLAQAELEERAHRDLLRAMGAHAEDNLDDLVRPDPHQQFASVSPTSLSAGSTAVAGTSKRTTTGNKSRTSRTSWAPSYTTGGTVSDVTAFHEHKGRPGTQPRDVSARYRSQQGQKSHTVGAKRGNQSVHPSGDVPELPHDSPSQQARAPTLKRQPSFAQKIAEYIRPPRPDAMDTCRNETVLKLTPSGSRAGLRRLVAVPVHRIETLAE
ncbi:hypothetical protein B0T20DRAFT_168145 [Sordaria brevicollis]|uniref:Uncharacterized protein n=1 Tax=Sordaria brevicollis TaxID=83679 RepID=A0AAE0UD29_SORBR|nr:hypothetical protein B0T20DRAFT_168145 [Sordaria brevicollis]